MHPPARAGGFDGGPRLKARCHDADLSLVKITRVVRAVYIRLPPGKKSYAKLMFGGWMALTVTLVVMIVGIVNSSWNPDGHIDRFSGLAVVGMVGVVASLAVFFAGMTGLRRRSV